MCSLSIRSCFPIGEGAEALRTGRSSVRSVSAAGMCRTLTYLPVLAAAVLSPAAPAMADRHCAPVVEAFWRARTVLMQDDLSCPERLAAGMPDLIEAAAQAEICGYSSLHARLAGLVDEIDLEQTQSCEARRKQLLEFSQELRRLVQSYH